MGDHTHAIVPIESWAFQSPELLSKGILVDIGHLAEALIYYDRVSVNVANQPQFVEVLRWFVAQGKFDSLLALINDGVLTIYEYSFFSAPIEQGGAFNVMHIQDNSQFAPNTFEERFLTDTFLKDVLPEQGDRTRLRIALRGKVTEAKATEFSKTIEEVRRDFSDGRRNSIVLQSFVDSVYAYRKVAHPPEVTCHVSQIGWQQQRQDWNVNFAQLSKMAGARLAFSKHTPITGNELSCRFIQSAANLNCDLYLPQPMSRLAGDKLFESARAALKPGSIIQNLEENVEFPDVRRMVNLGRLSLDDVLFLRSKSVRFRRWLQTEADRDRDQIIAYHEEVSKEAGFQNVQKKMLSIFGYLGGPALGAALGAGLGPVGSAAGAMAGGALTWAADIGRKLEPWRPVVFGNWYRQRIEELDRGRTQR